MANFFSKLLDPNQRRLDSVFGLVTKINQLEDQVIKLTDEQLGQTTIELKAELKKGKKLDDLLPLAFAVCREAIKRTIGERAYDVQLVSAIILHQGGISEQKTGEGKTHSVIFAAYLNALTGLGVHIITPNDYLTKVGAGWYPRALHLLGISTSCLVHEESFLFDPKFTSEQGSVDDRLVHLRPINRQEAYQADVVYGTNHEFGFDYLRDHMVASASQMVQREHYFAIVDEVDFVLIDEARTPLIISSPDDRPIAKYLEYANLAAQLQPTDYVIDEKQKSASLSEFGIRKVERMLNVKNLYEESFETIHYIENAIKAMAMYRKDKDYVVKDGQVIIVDEFTGRQMNGRRWSDGLHQAIEAKEGVPVQQESRTWATITFQNYFRLYQKLAGMTGTAATESEEFKKIYNLDVIPIPTNLTNQRKDHNDLIFTTQRAKYAAIANLVEEMYHKGQPVLIGTTSVEKNQIFSSLLSKKGVQHQVLNAKNHQSEAEIISKAGTKGTVTVATNMAGRGVDIILGGPKPDNKSQVEEWKKRHEEVVALGGLFVIGTERHESRRIDNQLRGRAGRQGDPGQSQFYVSLDDDLMRIFGGEKIASIMSRMNMSDDTPIAHSLVSKTLEQIQVKVESFNFDRRKNVVEYDDVVNKQRQIIYTIRDSTLKNVKTNPLAIEADIYKYLEKQINSILEANFDPTTGQYDNEKINLELRDILPIKIDLANTLNPKEGLMAAIKAAWQERTKLFGQDLASEMASYAIISTLDPLWVDHLTSLDDLRNGVGLRGYAQKDPLVEYRKEAFEMFQALMYRFEYNLSRKIFRLQPQFVNPSQIPQAQENRGQLEASAQTVGPVGDDAQDIQLPPLQKPVKVDKKPGRNDPCWCGSGKKYKKCHYPN